MIWTKASPAEWYLSDPELPDITANVIRWGKAEYTASGIEHDGVSNSTTRLGDFATRKAAVAAAEHWVAAYKARSTVTS